MSVKRILMAYDGSPNGAKALDWAIELAQQTAAYVSIIGVVDLGLGHWLLDEGVISESSHQFQDNALSLLSSAEKKAIEAGVKANATLLKGDPATLLIEYAQNEKVDLIICGGKGKGGLTKAILGSIAHKLVNYSPVPVVVVK